LVDDVYLSSDRTKASALLRFSGTMLGPLDPPGFAPTRTRGQIVVADDWEFRDDPLCHLRAVTNLADLARQIRAAPGPGTVGERMAVMTQRLLARGGRRSAR